MSFSRNLSIDLCPAFGGLALLWAMMEYCDVVSGGDLPWSVESAFRLGITVSSLCWLWCDAAKRRFVLLPVWGASLICYSATAVILVYLFVSRGRWGFVTLALYLSILVLESVVIRLVV
jgi:hypothetical protein